MAVTTQPVSLTVTFDAAGVPLALVVSAQLVIAPGKLAPVTDSTYPLTAADKLAVTTLWGAVRAQLGLP